MSGWEPPSVLGERLKNALVPPALYYRFRAHRELRRGERELGLLPYVLDRRRNSVDVGANKGVYTYWLQRYSRHAYAYEPNPKMFRVLAASAHGNVIASPLALSNANGHARLRVPRTAKGYSNQGASLDRQKVGSSHGEVEVETRRLDDEGLDDVGFIKIDVEGDEFAVLAGARDDRARPADALDRDRGDAQQDADRGVPGARRQARLRRLRAHRRGLEVPRVLRPRSKPSVGGTARGLRVQLPVLRERAMTPRAEALASTRRGVMPPRRP